MKTLRTSQGDFGPFQSIELIEGGWRCDGIDFLAAVVGTAAVVAGAPPATTPESTPPAPAIPQEVTRRQGLRALFMTGVTEAMVEDFIATIEDETARALALIDFRAAGTFMRQDPLVLAAGAHFDLDLDELFTRASSL